ncbi:universal stress protein [Pelagibius litoralis]|uniref:Universal stress protein n=1 Tax=Pelagibius litoralis TaxID=374515 RepID=A0A967EYK5_9PROT|nr:universal stress protein [Pelagibius litoralis]NIA69803.1 universal stress protein [Pelagibius litoralis]
MTGPILCAVDFSSDSRAALTWAAGQAALADLALVVLHVVHDPASSPGFYRAVEEEWLRPMAEVAEQMMEEFLAEVRAANPDQAKLQSAEVRLVSGLPAGRTVEMAKSIGASMIVVGNRGRTGLPHILLGSVAERIAQTAPVPVVVVKAPEAGVV